MKPLLMLTLASTFLSTAALAAPTSASDPMTVLTTASTIMSTAHSFTADMKTINSFPPQPGKTERKVESTFLSIECRRPNFARERFWLADGDGKRPDGAPQVQMISDGKQTYIINDDEYATRRLKNDGADAADDTEMLLNFFDPAKSQAAVVQGYRKDGNLHFIRLDAPEEWNGATYTVVEYEYIDDDMLKWLSPKQKSNLPNGQVITNCKCYIGAEGLIDRIVTHNNMDWLIDCRLADLKIDAPVDMAEFALPRGLTPEKPASALLPNGIEAPDFTVLTAKGKPIRLSDYQGSVVVIDFWATWCAPCQEALPGLEEVAAKYRRRGVVTLAIDVWDQKVDFDGWLPEHTQYSALTVLRDPSAETEDVASRLYHVGGVPTQYVIDRQGKLVAHFVGYGGNQTALESAIKSAL